MAQMLNGGEVRYMNNLFAEIAWSSSQVPLCVALVHSICSNSALSSGPRLTLTHTQCLDPMATELDHAEPHAESAAGVPLRRRGRICQSTLHCELHDTPRFLDFTMRLVPLHGF